MKKSHTYLSFILGLIISFPILFQSFHALEHHILVDDFEVHHCDSHNETESTSHNNHNSVEAELELCPICEYQIVYFFNEKQELVEQRFDFIIDFKTLILESPVVEYKDYKNKLRGPPII